MKHLTLLLTFCLATFLYSIANGQTSSDHIHDCKFDPCLINDEISRYDSANSFGTQFGVTIIDEQAHIGFRIQPEVKLSKRIGFGLDIPLLYNLVEKKIRTDEYTSGVGGLRFFRYFRYGRERKDPIYFRVGDISGTRLGYGILMNNYTNSPSYERRKVGLKYNFLLKKIFGIEGFYSDFETKSTNLNAIRGYIRPLGRTKLPWAKTIELGASYVQDNDFTNSKRVLDEPGNLFERYAFVKDGMRGWSFDAGIWFWNREHFNINGYGEFATLQSQSDSLRQLFSGSTTFNSLDKTPLEDGFSNGQGLSVGVQAIIDLGLVNSHMHAKVERLWYSDHFLPQFFSSVYELNKDDQIVRLGSANKQTGTYGEVVGVILDKIRFSGGVLIPDHTRAENPAYLSLKADLINLSDKFTFRAEYTKGNVINIGDAFSFDENSLARASLGYNFKKILSVGVNYYWTMTRTVNDQFQPIHYVTPYFAFAAPLSKNDNNE